MDSLSRLKKMPKKYRSDAFAGIQETMESLHETGAINKQTMRDVRLDCARSLMFFRPNSPSKAMRCDVTHAPVYSRRYHHSHFSIY
jgi:putative transcriptional regulator